MIHLANDYYLDADAYSYVIMERLVYKEGNHTGEEYFVGIGYHTTLDALFRAVNELLARKGIKYHWNKISALREYKALNRALDKVTEPTFTKAFFSMKKKYAKND